jgi:hypothetical protein
MPPKKQYDDSTQLLKEKLQGASRRNGRVSTTNGSNLKEVDNASTNSGQTSSDSNPSNVSAVTLERPGPRALRLRAPRLTITSEDQMGLTGSVGPAELPQSVPSRHPVHVQEPTEPRRPWPGHRPPFAHHGATKVETKGPQGPARSGSAQELQCAGRDRVRCHCRLAVQDEASG